MKFKNRPGQSLIELLAAIAVIQIGLFSVWSLFLANYNSTQESKLRIVGINLAREGIEIVKNQRDSNWLKRANNLIIKDAEEGKDYFWTWDNELADKEYAVSYDQGLIELDGSNSQLILDKSFYSSFNSNGSSTPYSRKISINSICCVDSNPQDYKCDDSQFFDPKAQEKICDLRIGINVLSEVSWAIGGHKRTAVIEENLYDWQ
jgi:type II secretory pathway pseudopilin PulG